MDGAQRAHPATSNSSQDKREHDGQSRKSKGNKKGLVKRLKLLWLEEDQNEKKFLHARYNLLQENELPTIDRKRG